MSMHAGTEKRNHKVAYWGNSGGRFDQRWLGGTLPSSAGGWNQRPGALHRRP